jgi:hypothetical protein
VDDVVVTGCCTAASCDDFDLCTNDVCDAQAGCIHPPRCDDGNACTVDICNSLNGACANTPLTGPACDDGNACTIGDACAAGACIGAPLTGPTCDDGNPCTQNDVCGAGVCAGTPAPPAELGDSLRVTKSGSLATVSWTDPPGPYAVYRGSRPGSGAWAYNHACFASPVPGSSAGDGALPGLGAAYYYLVTRKTACGESVPGRNSSGGAIPNASPCP